MSENSKPKFKWLEKLKKIKHIEVYVAVIFVVILGLIYLSNFASSSATDIDSNTISSSMSITAYVDKLESDLADILSNIGGVSNVKVMITLDMSNVDVVDSTITVNNGFPAIKGIIITANGVSDTSIKLKVLQAVEAVMEVTKDNIQILSSD